MPCQRFPRGDQLEPQQDLVNASAVSSVKWPEAPGVPAPPQSPSPNHPGTPEPHHGVTLARESLFPPSSLLTRPACSIPASTGTQHLLLELPVVVHLPAQQA